MRRACICGALRPEADASQQVMAITQVRSGPCVINILEVEMEKRGVNGGDPEEEARMGLGTYEL